VDDLQTVKDNMKKKQIIPDEIRIAFITHYESSGKHKFGITKHCIDRYAYFISGAMAAFKFENNYKIEA
jgi:hypothetical protein